MIFLYEIVVSGHLCGGTSESMSCFFKMFSYSHGPVHSSDISYVNSFVLTSLQAELEELVKREHARIDSQDKSGESKGAAAKDTEV